MNFTKRAEGLPLFSILIANHNNGLYLEECLHSIFNQTYKNWEIILVDDGSTDNSFEIYQKHETNSQVKLTKLFPNKGAGFTKRKCVEVASGEICGFLDADDTLAPDTLKIMVKHHLENPDHSIVYSTHYNCDSNLVPQNIANQVGQIPDGQLSWMNTRPIISHFATFKRKNYLQTSGIAPWLHKAIDKDLYYKLEETGPVLFINQPLYYYRHHQNSISLNKYSNIAYQYHLAIKATIIIRSSNRVRTLKQMPHTKSELANGLLRTAFHLFRNSRYWNGIELFFKACLYFHIHALLAVLKISFKKLLGFFSKAKKTPNGQPISHGIDIRDKHNG